MYVQWLRTLLTCVADNINNALDASSTHSFLPNSKVHIAAGKQPYSHILFLASLKKKDARRVVAKWLLYCTQYVACNPRFQFYLYISSDTVMVYVGHKEEKRIQRPWLLRYISVERKIISQIIHLNMCTVLYTWVYMGIFWTNNFSKNIMLFCGRSTHVKFQTSQINCHLTREMWRWKNPFSDELWRWYQTHMLRRHLTKWILDFHSIQAKKCLWWFFCT